MVFIGKSDGHRGNRGVHCKNRWFYRHFREKLVNMNKKTEEISLHNLNGWEKLRK